MTDHEVDCLRAILHGLPLQLDVANAVGSPADPCWLDDADGVIIGGSGSYSVHHPKSRPWVVPLHGLLARVLRDGLPGLGICFGHQLLGEHLGSAVRTEPTRAERGTIACTLTQAGAADPLFGPLGSTFAVHTGHSDLVDEIPDGTTLLASTDIVANQAMKVDGLPFWTAQFHPDLTAAEATARYRAYIRDSGGDPATIPTFDPRGDVSTGVVTRFAQRLTAA